MKEYEVEINGVTTTLQLSDEDAKARGLKPAESAAAKAKTPANKAATPANKAVSASQSKRDEAVGRAMNKPTKANG